MLASRNWIILQKGILTGFQNLQNIDASKSQKHIGDNKLAETKLDSGLLATNNLYATAARLNDTHTILQVCAILEVIFLFIGEGRQISLAGEYQYLLHL